MNTTIYQSAIAAAEKIIPLVSSFSDAFDAIEDAEEALASAQEELQLANEDKGPTDAGEIYDRIQSATRNVSIKEIALKRASEEHSRRWRQMPNTIQLHLPEFIVGLRAKMTDETARLEGVLKPLLPNSDGHSIRAMSDFIMHCTGVCELKNMLHRLRFAVEYFRLDTSNPRPLLDQLQAAREML